MRYALCVLTAVILCATLAHAQTPPPSGEDAAQALAASPRHGEYVDVPMEGPEAPIKTWVVYPERKDKAPVVLVIHEISGLTEWVRAVADGLAAEGFIAIAPDMLSGKGSGGGGTDAFVGDQVCSAIRQLSGDDVARRLDAVRACAVALPASSGKLASIGFCWGGTQSFVYAARQPALDAAVVYYGTAPDDRQALAQISCPVLGIYGGDDARVTSTVEATDESMKQRDKPFPHHVYDNAGHGFLRQQSGRDGANQRAAQRAWVETLVFLKKHID